MNNSTIVDADRNKVASGVNGYMRPVALVVLDQGGNIMKAPNDMFIVENAQAANADARAIAESGNQMTTNAVEVGQANNGVFYDVQLRVPASKTLDVQTTQNLSVRLYHGPKQTDYKEIFQVTGNKVRFDDTKKQITFTQGTIKRP